jgi:hypothetical protein
VYLQSGDFGYPGEQGLEVLGSEDLQQTCREEEKGRDIQLHEAQPALATDTTDLELEALVLEGDALVSELDILVVELDTLVLERDAPVLELDIPVLGLETPVFEEDIPVSELDTPVLEGDSLASELDTPVFEGDTPVFEGDTPVFEGDTPVFEGDTPVLEGDSLVLEVRIWRLAQEMSHKLAEEQPLQTGLATEVFGTESLQEGFGTALVVLGLDRPQQVLDEAALFPSWAVQSHFSVPEQSWAAVS